MYRPPKSLQLMSLVVAATWCVSAIAHADVVTEWDTRVGTIMIEARMGTPPANRVMAMVHTAIYEAINAITKRYPSRGPAVEAAPGASIEAAVAAAASTTFSALVPAQQTAMTSAYHSALATIADGPAKTNGTAVGDKAAAAVLAARAKDGAVAPETYRPHTTAGVYVPTVVPVVSQWPQRQPWLLTSPAQFRPARPRL